MPPNNRIQRNRAGGMPRTGIDQTYRPTPLRAPVHQSGVDVARALEGMFGNIAGGSQVLANIKQLNDRQAQKDEINRVTESFLAGETVEEFGTEEGKSHYYDLLASKDAVGYRPGIVNFQPLEDESLGDTLLRFVDERSEGMPANYKMGLVNELAPDFVREVARKTNIAQQESRADAIDGARAKMNTAETADEMKTAFDAASSLVVKSGLMTERELISATVMPALQQAATDGETKTVRAMIDKFGLSEGGTFSNDAAKALIRAENNEQALKDQNDQAVRREISQHSSAEERYEAAQRLGGLFEDKQAGRQARAQAKMAYQRDVTDAALAMDASDAEHHLDKHSHLYSNQELQAAKSAAIGKHQTRRAHTLMRDVMLGKEKPVAAMNTVVEAWGKGLENPSDPDGFSTSDAMHAMSVIRQHDVGTSVNSDVVEAIGRDFDGAPLALSSKHDDGILDAIEGNKYATAAETVGGEPARWEINDPDNAAAVMRRAGRVPTTLRKSVTSALSGTQSSPNMLAFVFALEEQAPGLALDMLSGADAGDTGRTRYAAFRRHVLLNEYRNTPPEQRGQIIQEAAEIAASTDPVEIDEANAIAHFRHGTGTPEKFDYERFMRDWLLESPRRLPAGVNVDNLDDAYFFNDTRRWMGESSQLASIPNTATTLFRDQYLASFRANSAVWGDGEAREIAHHDAMQVVMKRYPPQFSVTEEGDEVYRMRPGPYPLTPDMHDTIFQTAKGRANTDATIDELTTHYTTVWNEASQGWQLHMKGNNDILRDHDGQPWTWRPTGEMEKAAIDRHKSFVESLSQRATAEQAKAARDAERAERNRIMHRDLDTTRLSPAQLERSFPTGGRKPRPNESIYERRNDPRFRGAE